MSWNASFTNIDGSTKDDYDPSQLPAFGDPSTQVKEQFDAAVEAAVELIKSRTLGAGVKFNVHLNGHANPGHAPTPGWVNDCVTVTVRQVSE